MIFFNDWDNEEDIRAKAVNLNITFSYKNGNSNETKDNGNINNSTKKIMFLIIM